MAKRTFDREAPFQSIRGAAEITGLSMGSIRAGCKAGRIPFVMCGQEYRISMPLFLRQLEEEAQKNAHPTAGPVERAYRETENLHKTAVPTVHPTTDGAKKQAGAAG